ncbi:RICIN domain-containing protein [Comamonas sp. JC664]|uniref:RICIN domain-containing protein n=1 Tax=Comamonas sp. JC664 TaxID=2801917 RepID=UPI00174D7B93|nr:RICIN domain-containing protein [Comamonas sp. JC664]MBL0693555.1 RICIN domain-containing protein [Comamonas sp. JC664]GHG73153.1 glucosylceramidase [Comamonas sp. KCTC 72670]
MRFEVLLCTALCSAPALAANESVQVWLTTTSGSALVKRLNPEPSPTFGPDSGNATAIDVNPAQTFQTLDGFGGALTDASAWLIFNSPHRNAIMNDLFSVSGGAGHSMLRLPMGSSDFARNHYTYDDTCCDLNDFSVAHDTPYIIPLLQQARQLNPELKIMAVPWSAPAWMKFNNSLLGGGYLRNDHYGVYANYFVRFLQAYRTAGVPIHAVSIQNEPHNANPSYATMQMESNDQSNFAAHHLRPAMTSAGFGAVKILAWDHNWYDHGGPADYPLEVMRFNNGQAQSAVAGVAYHCYESPEGSYSVQSTFQNAFPGKEVHFTECTGGAWATNAAANLEWALQNNLFGPLRHHARSSLYWNLALDPNHGPRVGGCPDCRGMVTVNNSAGTYTRNEEFYAWAHLSKVVRSGAVRIGATTLGNNEIETVAFRNPDGSLALIALNSNDGASRTFKVRWGGQSFTYTLPARSVASFKWGGAPAYRLVNKHTGKCVDIAGPATADGTAIHQWACHSGASQQWTMEPTDSGYFRFVSRYSGKVLDVTGASTADGALAQQWSWAGGANQQFRPVSTGSGWQRLEARHSGKTLDVMDCWNTGDGARLQQWVWANNDCQQFRLEPM